MVQITPQTTFLKLLIQNMPQAAAVIQGNKEYPNLKGRVLFYVTPFGGILAEAEVFGLPDGKERENSNFYAFHIHETGDCTGDFSHTGMHYNPTEQPHPMHAGDMPPLLSADGYAWTVFYDDRFRIDEIIGRSVIIHKNPDDFTTQPSGNSGEKIGCGVIVRYA